MEEEYDLWEFRVTVAAAGLLQKCEIVGPVAIGDRPHDQVHGCDFIR